MGKATSNAAILSISLDKSSDVSLQSQLSQAIRELVHDNKLKSGDKLPSSRTFALDLSVSRTTITAVLDQLMAEGYLVGKRGSGVFVANNLPDLPFAVSSGKQNSAPPPKPAERIRPFAMASPDLRAFPHREWSRLHDAVWRAPTEELLQHVDPFGWWSLRVEIAEHLRVWRGLHCLPSQVMITTGLVESLRLICGAVLHAGDHVLMEEPGHQAIRRVLTSNNLHGHPVPVDEQGFNLDRLPTGKRTFKAAFLTPSRQFPLGMTLPLSRRVQLLKWASDEDAYIIEDDYDGEFRYQGQPLPAMMSLDQNSRVIYVGSFSKVLFPNLRLGFMVLPVQLIDQVHRTVLQTGQNASLIAQPVLSRFMSSGGFATHVRRMRRLYAGRQAALVSAVGKHAGGVLEVNSEPGGMHLVARLAKPIASKMSDVGAAKIAQAAGIMARPLAEFYAGASDAQGLVLGYSAFPADALETALKKLVQALLEI